MAWIYVILAAAVAVCLGFGGGAALGYQWGRSDGKMEERGHRHDQELRIAAERRDYYERMNQPRSRPSPRPGPSPWPQQQRRPADDDTVIGIMPVRQVSSPAPAPGPRLPADSHPYPPPRHAAIPDMIA